MADEIDRANEESERDLARALRLRRPKGPEPNGRCHYCDDIVADSHRWCSIECREDWERENNRKVRK